MGSSRLLTPNPRTFLHWRRTLRRWSSAGSNKIGPSCWPDACTDGLDARSYGRYFGLPPVGANPTGIAIGSGTSDRQRRARPLQLRPARAARLFVTSDVSWHRGPFAGPAAEFPSAWGIA